MPPADLFLSKIPNVLVVVERADDGSEAFTTPKNPLHERVSGAGLGLASQEIDVGLRLLLPN